MNKGVRELVKYKRRIYQNSRGTFSMSIPKGIAEAFNTRDVEIALLNDGDILVRPINKGINGMS